ncbi:hypothetical protein Tco_1517827, partial [Tanacetum coccineum]
MFQQHQGESLSKAWTRFKDLIQKVPHHGIDLWLQVQFFYEHVNPVTRRTIDQSAGGKLRDLNAEESWALLDDLALYDNESWNDPRDFAKPVKAIALPQDVPSTSDRRLIELENQVQRLMEAHLAPTQPTQVNKITTSCEICSGLHDTRYCMYDFEQAYVEYASSRVNEIGEKRLSHLRNQLGQQQDDMIGKINLLWKTVSEKLNDVSTPENAGNSMAPKSIAAISHVGREELRMKGIKSPKDSDTEKDVSSTNVCRHDLGKMTRGNEEVKKQGKEEDEMETNVEVKRGSFAYECDFMILEDTTSIIDRCLGEMVFGRAFIDETGLVYNEEERTVMFEQDDEKITFKMPHTMEIFKQTR